MSVSQTTLLFRWCVLLLQIELLLMLVTLHVRYIYLLFPYILTQVWSAMQLIFFPKKISTTYSASETNFSFPWILRHITLNLVCYDDSTITSYCSENLAVQITAATLSCRSQQLNRWMRYFLFKNNECRHLGSTLSPSPTSWPSWGWSSTWARQSRASVSSRPLRPYLDAPCNFFEKEFFHI